MRWSVILILICLFFLGLSLSTQSQLVSTGTVDQRTVTKIQQLKNDFIKTTDPLYTFHITELSQARVDPALLDPGSNLPRTHRYPYREIQALFQGMQTCRFPRSVSLENIELRKAMFWHQFICGKLPGLPKRFFLTRPLIHPLGSSYVYLAYKSTIPQFKKLGFLETHKPYMHLQEMSNLPSGLNLTQAEQVIMDLDPIQLQYYFQAAPTILTKNFILMNDDKEPSPLPRYRVYSRLAWETFWLKSRFRTQYANDDYAIYTQGNLAWTMNRNKLESKSQKYNLYAGSSAILLALNILFILYREIRRKVNEQQERLFILQTLTHELRTPVASMKLNLEPFRRNFDHLAPDGQKAFLRMTEGVRRLNHVIKASSQYLQSHTEEGQMKFQMDAVHSVNELAAYIVEDFVSDHGQIELMETDHDLSMHVDVYWLSMCLKNLFKNAEKYGVDPIQLKIISRGRKEVGFAVIDQGQLELNTLKGFLSPFQRQSKEEGLGLGLTLVNRIAKKMGGRLEVNAKPTTFCLWMPAFESKEDYDEIITG